MGRGSHDGIHGLLHFRQKTIPTTTCSILGWIVHLQTALRCQWDKCRKNNLLFVSPSIRCPTLDQLVQFFHFAGIPHSPAPACQFLHLCLELRHRFWAWSGFVPFGKCVIVKSKSEILDAFWLIDPALFSIHLKSELFFNKPGQELHVYGHMTL